MTANLNIIGLTREIYKGLPTPLCAGCGHNSITNHLIKALYEYGIEPHKLAKMSGIGCSSKTPAYFVEQAHGFNGLHGAHAFGRDGGRNSPIGNCSCWASAVTATPRASASDSTAI